MIYYKIRSKKSGLYCKGSPYAAYCDGDVGQYWSKNGKVWPTLGLLRAFLNKTLVDGVTGGRGPRRGIPDSWEVIECREVIESVKNPADWIDPKVLVKLLQKDHS